MSLLLVSLLVVCLVCLTAGQTTCPYAKYVGNNEQHIMCLPANTSCKIVNSGVSAAEQQLILKLHNDLRNMVAAGQYKVSNGATLPQAADMRQLVWSPELAKIAQAHANQCLITFECSNCRSTEDYITGENLYYYYYQNQPAKTTWNLVVNKWIESGKRMTSINYYPNRPGNFAQAIWGQTKDIGCGRTLFRGQPPKARFIDLYVCMYGPAGNYINMDVYEAGTPCSDCGFGETCSDRGSSETYPNLCKAPATST